MKILFSTLPASGHLHPLLPLADACRSAGHAIRFAIAPSWCGMVEKLGFEAEPAGTDYQDPVVASLRSVSRGLTGIEQLRLSLKLFVEIMAPRMAPELLTVVQRWHPDIMVADVLELASWVVAEKAQLRRVVIPYGLHHPSSILRAVVGDDLAALRRQLGLPADPDLATLEIATQFVFAPPGYQDPALPLPPGAHLFRPSPFDRTGPEALPAWVTAPRRRPLVYATLGTSFNAREGVLETMAEAARGEDLDMLLTIGRDRDPASFGTAPENVRIERYVPQSLLLPHCDAVVSHAGYGTVMATLMNGLPMVLVPVGADQPFHAARCADLGAAVVIDPAQLDPLAVRSALRRVLEDGAFRQSARRLQEAAATLPGPSEAVHVLELLAAGPGAVV